MKTGPLKFSLGVSLAVHCIVIGGALLLGRFHQVDATAKVNEAITLELIAAPSSPQQVIAQTPAPVLPLPPAALPPVEETLIPEPTAPPQPVAPIAVVIPEIVAPPTPPLIRGDSSSPIPGRDVTTAEGKPTAKAKPDYLKNSEPAYPTQARRRRQQGLVLLNVTVSAQGRATTVTIQQSSGYELLDNAALQAVHSWEFEPARLGLISLESKIEVPIRFKLTD